MSKICWGGGGVAGCCMGFVRATRSNTIVHMSICPAFAKTSSMSGAIYLIFSVFEVIWTIRLEMSIACSHSNDCFPMQIDVYDIPRS